MNPSAIDIAISRRTHRRIGIPRSGNWFAAWRVQPEAQKSIQVELGLDLGRHLGGCMLPYSDREIAVIVPEPPVTEAIPRNTRTVIPMDTLFRPSVVFNKIV